VSADESTGSDFIRQIIRKDVQDGRNGGAVVTRFPPEPNGYLHIGHAKAFGLNFEIASEFGGRCHLRFDDTNPATEAVEYVRSMEEDIRWLGFDWGEHTYYASDYFSRMYEFAVELIEKRLAFICDLSSEERFELRGTLTEAGTDSPYRDRSVEENLDLFERMKTGEFEPGERVLRAKIDMGSSVLNLRDPILYRVVKATHHRTGDDWCIYPMYDFAHCIEDAIEGVTHSLCSLEFVDHRPLYDWVLDNISVPCHPQQIEFARLNLSYTIMSKRGLKRLVEGGHVAGWDDPRMPTLAAMRRRGYPPEAIRKFISSVGVARRENTIQFAQLEAAVREHMNETAPRVMGVLDPLKLVIENYPEAESEELDAVNNPQDESAGTHKVPFSRTLYIERGDFMEDPPKKFHRLAPGREVRLRYAYFITCTDVVKNDDGELVEIRCSYDPATRGGDAPDGRKVRGTLHWVSAEHAIEAEVRLYDVLFDREDPSRTDEAGQDFMSHLKADSLRVVTGHLEPAVAGAAPGTCYQLERLGYFCVDPDSTEERLVLNRTVSLRDSWAKIIRQAR